MEVEPRGQGADCRGDRSEWGVGLRRARRHGLSPQQLFGWRRQLREAAAEHSDAEELQFVPAVVDSSALARLACGAKHRDAGPNPMSGCLRLRLRAIRSVPAADCITILATSLFKKFHLPSLALLPKRGHIRAIVLRGRAADDCLSRRRPRAYQFAAPRKGPQAA